MEFKVKKKDYTVTATISGDIGFNEGDDLGAALHEITLMDHVHHVVVNMNDVNSVTSNAIGKLINFFNYLTAAKKTMEIKGISDVLYDQFIDIHLDRVFPITKQK